MWDVGAASSRDLHQRGKSDSRLEAAPPTNNRFGNLGMRWCSRGNFSPDKTDRFSGRRRG